MYFRLELLGHYLEFGSQDLQAEEREIQIVEVPQPMVIDPDEPAEPIGFHLFEEDDE